MGKVCVCQDKLYFFVVGFSREILMRLRISLFWRLFISFWDCYFCCCGIINGFWWMGCLSFFWYFQLWSSTRVVFWLLYPILYVFLTDSLPGAFYHAFDAMPKSPKLVFWRRQKSWVAYFGTSGLMLSFLDVGRLLVNYTGCLSLVLFYVLGIFLIRYIWQALSYKRWR